MLICSCMVRFYHRCELIGRFLGQVNDCQVFKALQLGWICSPDNIASAVGIDDGFIGAIGGFADAFFIGHAHVYPQFNIAGQIFCQRSGSSSVLRL